MAPAKVLMSVVLPDGLSPAMPYTSSARTVTEMSSTARTSRCTSK